MYLVKKKKKDKEKQIKEIREKINAVFKMYIGTDELFPTVLGEVVNELGEFKAVIFEMPRRMGVDSETEEKLMWYFL